MVAVETPGCELQVAGPRGRERPRERTVERPGTVEPRLPARILQTAPEGYAGQVAETPNGRGGQTPPTLRTR